MKYFKIQVTVRGSMTTIFEIVSGDDIDTHTKKTPYNHFDTLKDAKRHALDNQPLMASGDHQGWRDIIRRTTMEDVWFEHFDDVADTASGYNELSAENEKLKNENVELKDENVELKIQVRTHEILRNISKKNQDAVVDILRSDKEGV